MKCTKSLLKIAAALIAVAGIACLLIAYWDKLSKYIPTGEQVKDKARDLKGKIPTKEEIKEKRPAKERLKEKLPTREQILEKLPTREELARRNPFRRAEIEAEFADYADVELTDELVDEMVTAEPEAPVTAAVEAVAEDAKAVEDVID